MGIARRRTGGAEAAPGPGPAAGEAALDPVPGPALGLALAQDPALGQEAEERVGPNLEAARKVNLGLPARPRRNPDGSLAQNQEASLNRGRSPPMRKCGASLDLLEPKRINPDPDQNR